jgi:hypothetical protein
MCAYNRKYSIAAEGCLSVSLQGTDTHWKALQTNDVELITPGKTKGFLIYARH